MFRRIRNSLAYRLKRNLAIGSTPVPPESGGEKNNASHFSGSKGEMSSEAYWSDFNVTLHKKFSGPAESLDYMHWRNDQYVDYIKFLPVSSHDGEVILDYGCGPGHDLIGFLTYSRPAAVYGMDISGPSLAESADRLRVHGYDCKLVHVSESDERIPLDDETVDYVHCSGVLNHVPSPEKILKEFRRILKPNGYARLMVYNRESLWVHLFVAHVLPAADPKYRGLSREEAFRRSTDTFDCPISRNWTPQEVDELASASGFTAKHLGNSVSIFEMSLLPQRFAPMMERSFDAESRRFLSSIEFDSRGVPHVDGRGAGIDGCYELRKAG
ncbi:class I SAM-dependent methyltransferase [Bradyrhizobium sp. AUGA SZCCT0274]|uniref:class I SAM-dependent methyltransferase n=1 Tax=Bradyrhizobium sp. AUGA SZCCT0274 TaxID=2807670 RepID=UPI001BADC0A1|nr:class I SAM-dependent methyltransferase [Bradyrhizobium sp. AUGA SZCCT0274]MBR1244192.1 class I SAM-dependent methyltransferase [Bradyrhizobium sp. AUGA SZCCT0274]